MSEIFDVHQQWLDEFGGLLVNGKVYYGKPNTDPTILANQIGIFADRELSTPLPNPQTIGVDGRVENKPWAGARYSIEVYDVNGVLNYTYPDNGTNPTSGGVTINLSNVIGINDITAESPDGLQEYVDQQKFTFEAVATNTDDMTLKIDQLDPKPINFNFAEEIKPGFFQSGQMIDLIYSESEDNFSWTNAGRGISLLTDVAGTANAITASGGPSKTAYVDKQLYSFKTILANLAAVTLKVDTKPAVSIKYKGAELVPGDLPINQLVIVAYDAALTVFNLVTPGHNAVAGRASTITGAVNSAGSTAIPFDDTIPQITEGNLILSLDYAAANVTNLLDIYIIAYLASAAAGTNLIMSLFSGISADALASAAIRVGSADTPNIIVIKLLPFVPGTIASTTYTVRAGTSGGNAITLNGVNELGRLGGTMKSGIHIIERLP